MNKPIFFSIVVPTYNRANIISRTIESIISQAYENYEVIIIDDGSTDDTEQVIQKYLSGKVHYYKKSNAERAAARNYGTSKALGDYINWFDSDDIMYPDNLAVAADSLHRYSLPGVLIQGYDVCDAALNVLYTSHFSANVNLDLYKGNEWGSSPVLVRKDIALANPFNEDRELSASEDYELWLRLAAKYQFYTSPGKTTGYIFHDTNSTITMSDPDQLIRRFTKFLRYTTTNDSVSAFLGDKKSYFVMKNYMLLAVDLIINNHKLSALLYLWKALKASPKLVSERGFYAFVKYFFKNIFNFR
jgi:glycosyltransferase involved in cell wall biosynthesis